MVLFAYFLVLSFSILFVFVSNCLFCCERWLYPSDTVKWDVFVVVILLFSVIFVVVVGFFVFFLSLL